MPEGVATAKYSGFYRGQGVMKAYIIKIDNYWYCGEGEEYLTQIPPKTDTFHSVCNYGKSGLALSANPKNAYRVVSIRNLKSHLEKILRCVQPQKLQIIQIEEIK